MMYLIYFLLALITASFDRWLGEILFFVFPIIALYVANFEEDDTRLLFLVLIYTIFYFNSRFELGFLAIIFFAIFLLINFFLHQLEMTLIKALIYVGVLSLYMSVITSSLYPFLWDMIIVFVLYFMNMRLVFNERKKS
ncbi:hypothetical protein HWHPT5561_08065 [Petrotoga sp. HWH.PT.55.6.1]|jgi:hypothetical protein|uniref:hypothetical protein n=1 Tax=unclassified Petrotoga TaxID=2620614 RepID=UPI000CA04F93|nr:MULTISPECIES: hypothetical protein [unclassified Petrotoga]MBL5981447.1 hypothetical protein [Petrotoga sp. 8T1HF07.NaAc.6.1]PNR92396.1 hypothetical protein X926_06295 [Petrotoga sp. HWHPT.55.6.3]RLL85380.1 hypothetical protein BZ25_03550 [Petrotoga sp. Shatin.DS.tank11.9.2.9.3]RLL88983.1 hypothetical protein CN13_07165 [Petrotoga sp. HKA.pet.4.5]RPD35291.1 hypothetical protein HWHPT5561_08065 [Petrotoga sp. HWH.PT.55.6.1]